jgi:hypothetical protein
MHAVYVVQHPRKPPIFVDGQEAGSVFDGRLSQINFAKHINNSGENMYFASMHVDSLMRKHSSTRSHGTPYAGIEWPPNFFFVREKANLTGRIVLGLEVVVIRPHAMKNIEKLLSRHQIAAMECIS